MAKQQLLGYKETFYIKTRGMALDEARKLRARGIRARVGSEKINGKWVVWTYIPIPSRILAVRNRAK